jgi:hypothetical protein
MLCILFKREQSTFGHPVESSNIAVECNAVIQGHQSAGTMRFRGRHENQKNPRQGRQTSTWFRHSFVYPTMRGILQASLHRKLSSRVLYRDPGT